MNSNNCEQDIYQNGEQVALIDGSSKCIQQLAVDITTALDVPCDWHYAGGRGVMLAFPKDTERVSKYIKDLCINSRFNYDDIHSMLVYLVGETYNYISSGNYSMCYSEQGLDTLIADNNRNIADLTTPSNGERYRDASKDITNIHDKVLECKATIKILEKAKELSKESDCKCLAD